MKWYLCLSWYLAGSIFGLTIAQFMTSDEAQSWKFLIATLVLLGLNLILLLYVVIKDRKWLK